MIKECIYYILFIADKSDKRCIIKYFYFTQKANYLFIALVLLAGESQSRNTSQKSKQKVTNDSIQTRNKQ